jgi:hypothetical protein
MLWLRAVDRIGERQPCLDKGVEVALTIRIELARHGERGIAPDLGIDAQTERIDGFQDVHHEW